MNYITNNSNDDILSFLQSQGIINLDDVQKNMKKEQEKKILNNHKYKIFQDKDSRWKTTVKDDSKKSGRRLVAKSTKEKLEEYLIEYYTGLEDEEYMSENADLKNITLRELFPKWLLFKNSHTNASSYIKRIKADWDKYYEEDKIVDIPIKNLTFLKLDQWAHNLIKENNLTKKQYYNATVIIRQAFDYACEPDFGIIEENKFARVKIKSNLFYIKPIPISETQVYQEDEQKLITKEIYKRIAKRRSLSPLMILLNFQIGLRIGELTAIKWSDINGKYIHISRMDVANFTFDKNGNYDSIKHNIVEYTKSHAGTRDVYLNEEALKILKMIKEISEEKDLYFEDYIYVSSYGNARTHCDSLIKYIELMCDKINMTVKSNHKIRKTYISTLIDKGVNINTVREQAGHEDERTTLHNYCFDTKTELHKEESIEKAKNKITSLAI